MPDRWLRQEGSATAAWTVLGALMAMAALIALADDTTMERGAPDAPAPTLTVAVGDEIPASEAKGAIPIVVTGNVQAMLQWCACETGTGFLAAKRATVIRQEREGAILIDAGEAFSGDTDLDRRRGVTQLQIMESLGYDAALLGPDALALGAEFPPAVLSQSEVAWACANLAIDGTPTTVWGRMREWEGRKVALVALVSAAMWPEAPRAKPRVVVEDPIGAYLSVVNRERPDVALAYGRLSEEDVRRLSTSERPPEAVFTSAKAPRERLGGMGRVYNVPDDPNSGYIEYPNAREFVGATAVYYTEVLGASGLISVRIGRRSQGYRHVQATGRTPDDPATKTATDGYFAQVRDTARQDAGKHVKSAWKEEVAGGRRFVGAHSCRECHSAEWTQWSGTKHAGAYMAVVSNDRWFYPLCVSCHSTGLGQPSGFEIGDEPLTASALIRLTAPAPKPMPQPPYGLEGVQCEVCHGPGSAHVADPGTKGTIARQLPVEGCVECHDTKNSPDFRQETDEYRIRIQH
ncbi:MAG: multiheme c-type cytochrome [Planctomycetota bacterium]